MKFCMHMKWTLTKLYAKKFEILTISRYQNLKKKMFFYEFRSRKMMSFSLLKLTDLNQIFTGGTSHHGLPPCKISFKSEHFKCQKKCLKIKIGKK